MLTFAKRCEGLWKYHSQYVNVLQVLGDKPKYATLKKNSGIAKIITTYPEGDTNVCTKFLGNLFSNYPDVKKQCRPHDDTREKSRNHQMNYNILSGYNGYIFTEFNVVDAKIFSGYVTREEKRKSQEVTKIMRVHSLSTVDVCTKFHCSQCRSQT